MDRRDRSDVIYEMIVNGEDTDIEEPPRDTMTTATVVTVPNVTALPSTAALRVVIPPVLTDTQPGLAGKFVEPPSYDVATKLPTYEEAEISKVEQEQQQQLNAEGNELAADHAGIPLGTDGMFVCTFIIAFLFNWIGLLAAICICQTIAARFGALAGFGLSLVKWVIIFKHNHWTGGMAENQSWVWWMFIIIGFVIFFRGCLHYVSLKHQWRRMQQIGGVQQPTYFYL